MVAALGDGLSMCVYINECAYFYTVCRVPNQHTQDSGMGWLRLVGCLKI